MKEDVAGRPLALPELFEHHARAFRSGAMQGRKAPRAPRPSSSRAIAPLPVEAPSPIELDRRALFSALDQAHARIAALEAGARADAERAIVARAHLAERQAAALRRENADLKRHHAAALGVIRRLDRLWQQSERALRERLARNAPTRERAPRATPPPPPAMWLPEMETLRRRIDASVYTDELSCAWWCGARATFDWLIGGMRTTAPSRFCMGHRHGQLNVLPYPDPEAPQ